MNKIREKVLFNSVIANGYYKRFQNVMVEYDTNKYDVKNSFKVARVISQLEPNDCIMIKRLSTVALTLHKITKII